MLGKSLKLLPRALGWLLCQPSVPRPLHSCDKRGFLLSHIHLAATDPLLDCLYLPDVPCRA